MFIFSPDGLATHTLPEEETSEDTTKFTHAERYSVNIIILIGIGSISFELALFLLNSFVNLKARFLSRRCLLQIRTRIKKKI